MSIGMRIAEPTALEALLRRDRVILVVGLIGVIALSWIWIVAGAGTGMDALEMTRASKPIGLSPGAAIDSTGDGMSGMPMAMVQLVDWTTEYALLMFAMWWVMMVAMMLPSASPMLLLFARVNRKEKSKGNIFVPTGNFAAGYLAVWGAFSAIATALQWSLEHIGLLSSMMVSTNAALGGLLLIAAGIWQLTPIKQACLRHCRSPIAFLSEHWHSGRSGAFRMGLEHGAYCLGCCVGPLFSIHCFWPHRFQVCKRAVLVSSL